MMSFQDYRAFSKYRREESITLFVETLTGTKFEMSVLPHDTIKSVKVKIQRIGGIPISQQHLIYNLQELDDASLLADYSVKSGSTLKLVLSMRGGPISTVRRVLPLDDAALRELMESNREELLDDLPPGCKMAVLVFRDGDQLNMFRVLENVDGSYSPLSDSSMLNLFEDEGMLKTDEFTKRFDENTVTMEKMYDLKTKLAELAIQRKTHKLRPVETEDDIEDRSPAASTSTESARDKGTSKSKLPPILSLEPRLETESNCESASLVRKPRTTEFLETPGKTRGSELLEPHGTGKTRGTEFLESPGKTRGSELLEPYGTGKTRGTEFLESPGTSRGTEFLERPGKTRGTEFLESPGTSRGTEFLEPPGTTRGTEFLETPGTTRGTEFLERPGKTRTTEFSRVPVLPEIASRATPSPRLAVGDAVECVGAAFERERPRTSPDDDRLTGERVCQILSDASRLSRARRCTALPLHRFPRVPPMANSSLDSDQEKDKISAVSCVVSVFSRPRSGLERETPNSENMASFSTTCKYSRRRSKESSASRFKVSSPKMSDVLNETDDTDFNYPSSEVVNDQSRRDSLRFLSRASRSKESPPESSKPTSKTLASLNTRSRLLSRDGDISRNRSNFHIQLSRNSSSSELLSYPDESSFTLIDEERFRQAADGSYGKVPTVKGSQTSLYDTRVKKKKKEAKARCTVCRKRLTIISTYTCRCGNIFCSIHRYSEAHDCDYDYKEEGRRILEQNNPLIRAPKLPKI